MARARRMEAPKAEEPKERPKFDFSDLETTAAETPKAKRKRAAAKPESVQIAKPVTSPGVRLPGVHERKPRKGGVKSEVEEALDDVRRMSEESAWDKAIGDAKKKVAEENAWDAKIAEAKQKADQEIEVSDEDVESIEMEAEPASDEERAEIRSEELEWDKKIAAAKEKAAEEERAIAAYAEAHPETRPMDAGFSKTEEAWFKKGEEEEIEAVRAGIESHGNAPLIETPGEIDANVRQAEAMIASGELNKAIFNVEAYRKLLQRKVNIDADLEDAGWWEARQLRAELKKVTANLSDYENQIQFVVSGRRPSGALTAREKEDIRYKGPMRKPALPQGSGTTVHKKSWFSRLFGKK